MFTYHIDANGVDHTINSPQQLTAEELQWYTILLNMGFVVVLHADDSPTAVLVKNGVEVCLIDVIVSYTEDADGDEISHTFENINEFIRHFEQMV